MRVLVAVGRWCEKEGADIGLFIAANMVLLRDFAAKTRYGFQHNMLQGSNAIMRYNSAARRLSRQFHHAGEEALAEVDAPLRSDLFWNEKDMGHYLVGAWWAGEYINWEIAQSRCNPSDSWMAMNYGHVAETQAQRKLYEDIRQRHDGEWVERMMRSCRASAAVAVTNQLHPGLSDRIGVSNGEVSWMALARVICNVVPRSTVVPVTSPGFFSPVICD